LWDQAQAAGFTSGSKVHLDGPSETGTGSNGVVSKTGEGVR